MPYPSQYHNFDYPLKICAMQIKNIYTFSHDILQTLRIINVFKYLWFDLKGRNGFTLKTFLRGPWLARINVKKKTENLNVSQVMMGSPNHPQDPIILLRIMWFFDWWGMNQVITQRGASFMISLVDGIFEKGETLKLELK